MPSAKWTPAFAGSGILQGSALCDTAWFAMTDQDWPRLKAGYETWLRPENFDASGQQIAKLTPLIAEGTS
jgi:hypothetical protein